MFDFLDNVATGSPTHTEPPDLNIGVSQHGVPLMTLGIWRPLNSSVIITYKESAVPQKIKEVL